MLFGGDGFYGAMFKLVELLSRIRLMLRMDSIYFIEKIIGSGKNDTFYYSDAIQSVSKVTLFDVGAGKDVIDFSKSTAAITYTLNEKAGEVETDNFEDITGSTKADTLTGDSKRNIIISGGHDILIIWPFLLTIPVEFTSQSCMVKKN